MTQPTTTATTRLLRAVRLVPAALLLAGVLHGSPAVGATGCHLAPASLAVNGGVSRNVTNVTA
ncbi:MAG: hypothetical protein M3509_06660, partial [Chloroflexota bacterium]|nr:hypothetical protein [Chloroflexota bacterium]